MPAKSEAQRRFLYAKFGSAWVHRHHFANKGRLRGRLSEHHKGVLDHKRILGRR